MPPNDPDATDADLGAAVVARDAARLVHIYTREADRLEKTGQKDAACFFLTHAYIWALDADLPETSALHARLKAAGREE